MGTSRSTFAFAAAAMLVMVWVLELQMGGPLRRHKGPGAAPAETTAPVHGELIASAK